VLSSNDLHTQALYSYLPPMASELINNMHIKFNASIDDTFLLTGNKNETYTTKSGYTWLLSPTSSLPLSNQNGSWTWIWKLKLPEKLKFMFWLACHNSVPTLSLLNHRNFSPSIVCTRCILAKETFLLVCETALSLEVFGSLLVIMIEIFSPTWM